MQIEQQYLPLPSHVEDVSEGNYYSLEETNPLVLTQYLAKFFFGEVDKQKAIGLCGKIDTVLRAGLLCSALNPLFDIKCSTGVTADGVSVVILISYPTDREKRIQKILSQNDWDTYALLIEKDQFMCLTPPDSIHVDGDKRTFTWEKQNMKASLYLWECWEVKDKSFSFQETDLLLKMLPQKEETEWDDRFCGAVVAIKVAQSSGMLNKDQVTLLFKVFCKAHDLVIDEEEAEKLLVSECVNRYADLIVEKNK